MLDRDNLLDIIRTFTLFSTSDKGEIIKIVGRYQQFRAARSFAISRSANPTSYMPSAGHAIRHHLDVELDDDPDLQASFAEALKAIFAEFKDNWNKIYEELEKLRQRIINADKEPTFGLHRKKQMPFFRMLKKEIFGDTKLDDDSISSLVSLTQQVFDDVERELKLAGFWESIPARNKLKADIQKTLLQPEFSKLPELVKNRAHIISRIMEIAEKNHDTILYAP
jgi:type I restriction enzyme R subunit